MKMTRGEAMKLNRIRKGYTAKRLAEEAGVSRNTVLRGEASGGVSITVIELMADILGLSIDEYIGHEVQKDK